MTKQSLNDPFIPFYIYQIKTSIADKGFLSTVKTLCCLLLLSVSKHLKIGNQRYFEEYTFDFRHGTETQQIIVVENLAMDPSLKSHAVQYEPTRAWLFYDVMDKIKVELSYFSFIDFGSGKGRVLLLASKFPFKNIIGLEASPELCQFAENNIHRFRAKGQRCIDITSVCIDARDFTIPEGDIVLYFYNPFDRHILLPILKRIEDHCQKELFRIIIIYINPVYVELFEQSKFFQLVEKNKRYSIFFSKFRCKDLSHPTH
jgi:SAM-dependent methyltransferase